MPDAKPMAPADAMWHWFSTKFATDQFMVYAFAGAPDSIERAIADVVARARTCDDLGLTIRPRPLDVGFPLWVPRAVGADQVCSHSLDDPTWPAFLARLAGLVDDQLDPRTATWRLHVFGSVAGVPGAEGPTTVTVLQISHALGDGTRTAALAGYLFGREAGPEPVAERPRGSRVRRILESRRAHDQLALDTDSGAVPAAKSGARPLSTNNKPVGARVLRTRVCRPDELPGPTVLVGALVAISEALSGYLNERGEDTSELIAEVPTAKPGVRYANNHFAAPSIGLYPDASSRSERLRGIVGDLMAWRRRSEHPAFAADDLAFDAIPAVLRHLGIWRVNPDRPSPTVQSNTAVSSVDRGAADLSFGGCPVILTSSYPSLLPQMALAHGVHKIGDTVAISVHTTDAVITDVDEYFDRIDSALRR
jgi:hypothetical protein